MIGEWCPHAHGHGRASLRLVSLKARGSHDDLESADSEPARVVSRDAARPTPSQGTARRSVYPWPMCLARPAAPFGKRTGDLAPGRTTMWWSSSVPIRFDAISAVAGERSRGRPPRADVSRGVAGGSRTARNRARCRGVRGEDRRRRSPVCESVENVRYRRSAGAAEHANRVAKHRGSGERGRS